MRCTSNMQNERGSEITQLENKERRIVGKQAYMESLSRLFSQVLMMCRRHPAKSDVLLEHLEGQLSQEQNIVRLLATSIGQLADDMNARSSDDLCWTKIMASRSTEVDGQHIPRLHRLSR